MRDRDEYSADLDRPDVYERPLTRREQKQKEKLEKQAEAIRRRQEALEEKRREAARKEAEKQARIQAKLDEKEAKRRAKQEEKEAREKAKAEARASKKGRSGSRSSDYYFNCRTGKFPRSLSDYLHCLFDHSCMWRQKSGNLICTAQPCAHSGEKAALH